MNSKQTKLVVFDLDGTLLDSFPSLASAMHEVLTAHGLQMPADALLRAELSKGLNAMFDCARSSNPQVSDDEWSSLRTQYERCYETTHLAATPLFAGVAEALQTLNEQGMRLAVCTNRDRRTSEMLLEQGGLSQWLCALVAVDDMPRPKPAPDGLIALANEQGVALADVIFVGDSAIDCQTAHAARVEFHAHLLGYHSAAEELTPHAVAFRDYARWLEGTLTQAKSIPA